MVWIWQQLRQTNIIMGNLLYIIAVVLLIGWVLGFFVYSAGSVIHVLLVIAVIAIVLQVVRGQRA
jgi:hypothetical protein